MKFSLKGVSGVNKSSFKEIRKRGFQGNPGTFLSSPGK
jgi:hypothetical protein